VPLSLGIALIIAIYVINYVSKLFLKKQVENEKEMTEKKLK
jgi:hypothetical protein